MPTYQSHIPGIRRSLVTVLLAVALAGLAAEDATSAANGPQEKIFTLKDGRTVTGVYDDADGAIRIQVGKSSALIKASRDDIVSESPAPAAAADPQPSDADHAHRNADAKTPDDASAPTPTVHHTATLTAKEPEPAQPPAAPAAETPPPPASPVPIPAALKTAPTMDAAARAAYWQDVRGYTFDPTMTPAQMDAEAKSRDDDWQTKITAQQLQVSKAEQALHAAQVEHQAYLDKQAARDLDDLLHPAGTTVFSATGFPAAFQGEWQDGGKTVWRLNGNRRTHLASGMEEGFTRFTAVMQGGDLVRFTAVSQIDRGTITVWRMLPDGRIEETHVEDGAIKGAPLAYTITPSKDP
jgi:hypothetical protein